MTHVASSRRNGRTARAAAAPVLDDIDKAIISALQVDGRMSYAKLGPEVGLSQAAARIGHCQRCRTFSEVPVCALCGNGARDASQLCVVETPVDQLAIEQATGYRGLYFVLLGRLSPLDGLGPGEIGMELLAARLAEGEVRELIVATNPTVEGEATAHYVAQLARPHGVRVSRLAHGVPLGGEREFVDRGTLAHAFGTRQPG